jgi:ribosomal protein L31
MSESFSLTIMFDMIPATKKVNGMQTNIHPDVRAITLSCSGCGTNFSIYAPNVEGEKVLTESCSNCHSAWTGKRVISNQGAAASFKEKYSQFGDDLF